MTQERQISLQQATQLASDLINAGRFNEAEELCQKVLEIAPKSHDALYLRGHAAHRSGRFEQAVQYLQVAVSLNPHSWNYRYSLAVILYEGKELSQAQIVLQSALEVPYFVAEDKASGFNLLARILNELGDTEKSVATLQQACSMAPANAMIGANLAQAYVKKGHYREAVELCKKIMEVAAPTANLLHAFCESLGMLQRYDEAISANVKWVELCPADSATHYSMGLLYIRAGRYPLAEKALRNAIRISARNPDYHASLADVLVQMRKYEEAIAAYKTAVDAEQVRIKRAYYLDGLARSYSGNRNYEAAARTFDEAFSLQVTLAKWE